MNKTLRALSLSLLLWPLVSFAAEDPLQWLERMGQSQQTMNFEGQFVHVHDGEIQSMHILHAVTEEGVQERVFALNGHAREIIRQGDQCTCIWPDLRLVVVGEFGRRAGFSSTRFTNAAQLDDLYTVVMGGVGRVADRPSQIIEIRPRDTLRYGFRLWLERQHGMLLRVDLLDEQGHVLEQTMFTHLEVLPTVDFSALQAVTATDGFRVYREEKLPSAQGQGLSEWMATELPAGFQQKSTVIRMNPRSGKPMRHIVYTDGLATVSVFIEALDASLDKAPPMVRGKHMGAVNAHVCEIDGFRITVVGEVPEDTVRRIGDHMRPGAGG